ncbi:exonuclease/endonuclease/phosphatase family protein [Acetobacter pasteurianus]|uniref:endonuclease/exonuclease/phosphatase family protein n=1 Tax=Acetobacter pasteurianus TaxID=438 RepID=UPI0013634D85|nr:endonuclease/exonuclease/phosphatase family protein [Acetobacter pasteurianus]QHM90950.1 endonuclease/exonuclease/phosphatase family protein [Acetobacter pasteurianus]
MNKHVKACPLKLLLHRWKKKPPKGPSFFFSALVLVACCLSFTSATAADTLKLSTWNLDWLLDPVHPSYAQAPPDIPHRTSADISTLASYAAHLHGDVVALQEVESPASAGQLFPFAHYRLAISQDHILQHTALAVRADIPFEQNPDVTALDAYATAPATHHHLRSGLDITLHQNGQALRILVVHLKAGCPDNLPHASRPACTTLWQQFAALDDWVADRTQHHEAFAIMGDFNRHLTVHDPLFLTLLRIAPLDLATAGMASPCQGGSYFIDHIILGGAARAWKVPNSLRVIPLAEETGQNLSDHCPVSISLRLPSTNQPPQP